MLPREELFFRILIFFAIITGVIGVLNTAQAMNHQNSLTSSFLASIVVGNGADTKIPGQMNVIKSGNPFREGANSAPGILVAGIDFTTASSIDTNTTTLSGGIWTLVPGTGMVLTSAPFLGASGTILLRNVQSVGNVYTVNVIVDNSQSAGIFNVLPRFYADSASVYDIRVVFESDGVHIKDLLNPSSLLLGGNNDVFFYPLPGASTTIPGGSTITTILTDIPGSQGVGLLVSNDQNSILTVAKDGVTLFTTNVASGEAGPANNNDLRHGGIGSNSANFIVKGFPTTPMLSTEETIISNAGGTVPSDPLSAFGSFLALIPNAMGIADQALIPAWLTAIILLPCLAVLTLIGIEILRGV